MKYCGWNIDINVGVRLKSGLGSSSCLILGMVKLFHTMFELPDSHQDVYSIASRIETSLDPLVSGIDMATSFHGGSQQFRIVDANKTHQHSPIALPLSSFYLIHTGVLHNTKQSLECLNSSHDAQEIYASIGKVVDNVVGQLKSGDMPLSSLERALKNNHQLLCLLGVSCAEADAITAIVPTAKITGSGNGGYLMALALTEQQKQQLTNQSFEYQQVFVTHTGVEIFQDNRYNDVPHRLLHLQQKVLQHYHSNKDRIAQSSGYGTAPSNIALIKYWGKIYKQLPLNPSISYTIGGFRSFTRAFVESTSSTSNNSFTSATINTLGGCSRSQQFLDKMLPLNDVGVDNNESVGVDNNESVGVDNNDRVIQTSQTRIESFNNFPSSCGIASSASGFCAMVMAVNDLFEVHECLSETEYKYWTDTWCRLGSGSSVRSTEPGFNTWEWSVSNKVESPLEPTMHHLVVIMNQQEKKISSGEGHKTVDSSLFQTVRKPNAFAMFPLIVDSLKQGDFQTLKLITEEDAMFMHCVMNTSNPQCNYLSPDTVAFVNHFITYTTNHNIDAMYTIDAGPNVHILSKTKQDHAAIVTMIKQYTNQILAPPGATSSATNGVPQAKQRNLIGWIENTYNQGATQGETDYTRLLDLNAAKKLNKITMAKTIFVIRGKRYCGKTTFANKLRDFLTEQVGHVKEVVISSAIKKQYAELHNLDYKALLYDSAYKEPYRHDMVKYRSAMCVSTNKPHYWAELACASLSSKYVIIQDVRYKADLDYIRTIGNVHIIEIKCTDAIRTTRGWKPSPVDTMPSETDLDGVDASMSIVNDETAFNADHIWANVAEIMS